MTNKKELITQTIQKLGEYKKYLDITKKQYFALKMYLVLSEEAGEPLLYSDFETYNVEAYKQLEEFIYNEFKGHVLLSLEESICMNALQKYFVRIKNEKTTLETLEAKFRIEEPHAGDNHYFLEHENWSVRTNVEMTGATFVFTAEDPNNKQKDYYFDLDYKYIKVMADFFNFVSKAYKDKVMIK